MWLNSFRLECFQWLKRLLRKSVQMGNYWVFHLLRPKTVYLTQWTSIKTHSGVTFGFVQISINTQREQGSACRRSVTKQNDNRIQLQIYVFVTSTNATIMSGDLINDICSSLFFEWDGLIDKKKIICLVDSEIYFSLIYIQKKHHGNLSFYFLFTI